MSGTSVGIMVGPTIGGWLYEAGGIRLPFVFVSLLAAVCAGGFLIMTPPGRASRPRGRRRSGPCIRVADVQRAVPGS